jgi:clathrin heavy chain
MPEDVLFWKWVNSSTIGLVTEGAVYHWQGTGDSAPQKVFDRHASLAGSQIINYRVNSDGTWMLLIGISAQVCSLHFLTSFFWAVSQINILPQQGRVVGNMQLYSKERAVSQPIEGHAACFGEIKLDPAAAPNKIFTFSVRTANGAKVSHFFK